MAGHRRGDAPERVLGTASRGRAPRDPRPAPARSPRSRPRRAAPEPPTRRRLSPPNSSTSKPNRSSVSAMRGERLALRRRQLDQQRRQQPLALEPADGQLLDDLLEQHPLVRHVLIDDRDPLVVDGDDEGVAELAERNHRAGRRRGRDPVSGQAAPAAGPPAPAGPPETSPGGTNARSAASCSGLQRFPIAAPASTPGIVIGRGSAPGRTDGRQLQLRRAALPQRIAETAPQHLVDERLFEEPHLRLRRMHVDVDAVRRNLDEQVHLRAALLDRRDAVGLR